MILLIRVAFFAALLWFSYKAGEKGAGYGVALFIIGSLLFVMFVDGPEALFSDECERYSSFANDC